MKCPFCDFENIDGVDQCEECQEDLRSIDLNANKNELEPIPLEDPISRAQAKDIPIVDKDSSILEAVQKMNSMERGCVLVQNSNKEIIGIFTERDLLFRTNAKKSDLAKTKISNKMTYHVDTLNEDNSMAYALYQLSVNRIRHIPIIRKNGPAALLSSRDVLKYISKNIR